MNRPIGTRVKAGIIAALLFTSAGVADNAVAGDLLDGGFLRGSYDPEPVVSSYTQWDGIYVGGTFGASSANADFGNGTKSLIQYILRNTTLENEGHISDLTTLSKTSTSATSYGGFVGYNFQIDPNLVLGLELTYNKVSMDGASSSDSLARSFQTSDDYFHNVNVSSQASLKLIDYATVRARAGYVIDQFMPYAFVGLAVGRADVTRSATVSDTATDVSAGGGRPTLVLPPTTNADARQNIIAYGVAAGLGLDVALLPNVFLRGEWEYIAFKPINDVKLSMNSGRVGVGVKF